MKPVLKLVGLFLFFSLIFALLFLFFGEEFERLFSFDQCIIWFESIKPFAWIVGILLLVADLFLPIPATGVVAALGVVYGMVPGALLGIAGSTCAGITGYITARYLGDRATRFIVTQEEIESYKGFFNQWGAYAIIISRVMPIMPEVLSILAGFSEMKFRRFTAALIAGTIPACFLFSWVGQAAGDFNTGLLIAVLLPMFIWPLASRYMRV